MSLNAEFQKALFGEDELGAVVRAHIHIEAQVNTLLSVLVPFPNRLPRLRFEQMLNLACALGLRDDSIVAFKELGNIRNQFGHQLNTRLTTGMVEKMIKGLSLDDLDTLLLTYEITRQQTPSGPFETLSAKDKFIILCVSLDKLLLQSIEEVKNRADQP
jgi:hypothetical protein